MNIVVLASTTILISVILQNGKSTLLPTSRETVPMPTAMLMMMGPAPTSANRIMWATRLSSIKKGGYSQKLG
jgi:hypothetical protein